MPPLATCETGFSFVGTALLVAIAALYLTLVAAVLLKRPRSAGLVIVFLGGSAFGVCLALVLLAFLPAGIAGAWRVLPWLIIFAVAVGGGATWARSSRHPPSGFRAAAAVFVGIPLPAFVTMLPLGLAATIGSACLG